MTAGVCALHLGRAQLLRNRYYWGCVTLRVWALVVTWFGVAVTVSIATSSSPC